jgi:altronate dehydratase
MKAQAAKTIAALVLNEKDDVAVLVRPVAAGEFVTVGGARGTFTLRAKAATPLGHKLALHALAAGSDVRKYGEVIGRLTADVAAGEHVHVHNLTSLRAH